MVNKKPIDLSFSDDDKDSETDAKSSSAQLRINKNYAQKYDNWRSKEEIQKRTILKLKKKKRKYFKLNFF